MTRRHSTSSGFSLTEMVIAFAITTVVVAAAATGWVFFVRGETMNSTQTELDINVRNAMENLKHDLRLSTLDSIYYYPAGPGPYTAISFPMASDTNNDGLVEKAAGGSNVLWTSTVIYHVWKGSPNELRKTVFSPRDNSLTAAQCQAQLNSVVSNGDGTHTYGAGNSTTRALFKNLFTWNIWGSGAIYDGYSANKERDPNVSFGSVYLGPGSHEVKFKVVGKNAASSGFNVGIDTLTATACGVEREGESQTVSNQSGASAGADYQATGSWSGNYQLLFQATASNNYFSLSIDNDRWEETNFRGQGALCTRTIVGFDPSLSPSDYILQLAGSPGYPWSPSGRMSAPDCFAWTAENQTGSSSQTMNDNSLTNCVVRVLLRGNDQSENNGNLRFSGSYPYVYFAASPSQPLQILAAYIAEAATATNYTQNAASAGTPLYFYGDTGRDIQPGQVVYANPSGLFHMDQDKSYLVTMLIGSSGNPLIWPETHSGAPGSYIIPASASPTAADAQAADWSSKSTYPSSNLYGVYAVYCNYPSNGLYTSQIFDTKIDTPIYSTVSWNGIYPYGTSIKMKVRTGAQADLSDAQPWTNISEFASSPATITCGNYRYVQFQAILNPDLATFYKGSHSPKLKDVTIKWAGATRVVDVGATMTKGPDYGICEVSVDGNPLTKGLRIDLTIFKEITGWGSTNKMITSSMTAEISPRNTGK